MKTEQLKTFESFCSKKGLGRLGLLGDQEGMEAGHWRSEPCSERVWEALSRFLPGMINLHYSSSGKKASDSHLLGALGRDLYGVSQFCQNVPSTPQ